MAPPGRGLGPRRWICIFLAVCLVGLGVIFVSLAPTVAGDISQARTLAARGVRVPLTSATFTTRKQSATRAVGADSCAISGGTVRFTFNGAPRSATLREVMGADLPTCADALDAAAKLDYAPGTPLLVDPQDPTSVALSSEVAKQNADVGRADGLRTAGIVLLVLGAVFALLALVPSRRGRAPQQPGSPGPLPYGPRPPSSLGPPSFGPQLPFGPRPPSSFGPSSSFEPPSFGPPAPAPFGRPNVNVMPPNHDGRDIRPKHRPLGEQLHRSPTVLHASWLAGLSVLLAGVGIGGFNLAGLVFLAVVFLPVIVAYRRDRLSFPIVFASLFLPAWPWAMWKAASSAPRPAAARDGEERSVTSSSDR